MAALESFGKDPVTERNLFVLELDSASDLRLLELPGEHFACLIAWDSCGESPQVVEQFARQVVGAGAAYVCCWGTECESVHDAFDTVDSYPNIGAPDGQVIITAWHSDEPLYEAIWFFLCCTLPDEYAQESLTSAVAISVGNSDYSSQFRSALKDPRAFVARVVDEQENVV